MPSEDAYAGGRKIMLEGTQSTGLSFAEAARRLRLSPSVATRSVAQLEDQLGLTLLTRTTRSLRLTGRGEIFLESCQQILEDMNGAERLVRGESAEPRGELSNAQSA